MWPWGHLGFSYLCYLASIEGRDEGEQTLLTLVAVAIGSQFPDLVDKPLASNAGILPTGRSLAHSLGTATVVIGVVRWIGRRRGREEEAFAFSVGYLTHSLADLEPGVVLGLLSGDRSQLKRTTFLFWPFLPSPEYPHPHRSIRKRFSTLELDQYTMSQFVLFGIATVVWVATGIPGVGELRREVRNRL
ncbi:MULTISPECIES: metal-dependent hydrolase [unclassified Haladaptatus]|uniref:metal-dependent hydrolase n=1 Tax=unclassified Haladaptatus TaxID=2622732 RepID=UPI00209BF0C7|nr:MULTISPECIES: metal-dependent hydrolase [unclassified Haladaptatus]MCO8244779.1 metal-dependent hydrolase [Haladaptatus sp. AB643]MCO8255709.1 metal-dependent hydrolase [Haladaptatus sp. AB618]